MKHKSKSARQSTGLGIYPAHLRAMECVINDLKGIVLQLCFIKSDIGKLKHGKVPLNLQSALSYAAAAGLCLEMAIRDPYGNKHQTKKEQ